MKSQYLPNASGRADGGAVSSDQLRMTNSTREREVSMGHGVCEGGDRGHMFAARRARTPKVDGGSCCRGLKGWIREWGFSKSRSVGYGKDGGQTYDMMLGEEPT